MRQIAESNFLDGIFAIKYVQQEFEENDEKRDPLLGRKNRHS